MLLERRNKSSGLDFKKFVSGLTGILMITTGLMVMVPLTMPNASAYMTPPGVVWTWDQMMLDADLSTGGIAVTYNAPYDYSVHEDIIIDQTSMINTEGPEFTQMDMLMGIHIFVEGMLDANMGGTFVGWGAPGDWQGFVIQNGGFAMMSGMMNPLIISDAMVGILDDNSIMMGTSVIVDNCLIDNCAMSGIMILEDMGNPMINGNTITNCGTGIYLQGNTDAMIIGNHINNNMNNGIHLIAVTNGVMIDSNTISDSFMSSGIYMQDSFAFIMNNWIYGWNATPSSFQPGGPAIRMTGNPQWTTMISWNTIVGGRGHEYGIAGLAPDGGHGIWLDYLEGMAPGSQVIIENNPLIKGGDGGPNAFDDGLAGAGGDAIRVDGIPDMGDPWSDNEAVRIIGNSRILGGRGADNNCAQNGVAGDGGYGIRIIDDDFAGSQEISDNTFILAGNGGHNFADDMAGGSNWHCGDGGDGIYIQDAWMTVPTEVLHNPHVEGGNGGNGTGTGQFKKAGKGGDGIHFKAVTNATIDPTIAFGGDGGNNTGSLILAGDGGDGILIDAFADRFSAVMLMDVNGTGGEGGDNYVAGGPGGGGAGTGGDGLEVDGASMAFSTNSNYTGGKGGDTYADMDFGGMGGHGVYVWNASTFTAFKGTIIGGDGGDSRYNGPPGAGCWGGNGGMGVFALDALTFIDIVGNYITGGGGGDNLFDLVGFAGRGGSGVYAWNMDMVQLMDSGIKAGPGGTDYVNSLPGNNGSEAVHISTILMGAIIDNITAHGAYYFGVLFDQTDGTLMNSEIYNCGIGATRSGVLIVSSNPLVADNYIHNCTTGIRVGTNSNPDIDLNTIENTQYYGIYVHGNSHPHIDRTTVDNSGEYGMRLTGGYANTVENCTITNSGIADWYVDQNSHPVSLNTTNDKTVVINDALSDLTMNWYMHTQVVDQFLAPVGGAEVWINDTFGTNILNAFTPVDGWLRWTVVTEFIETQAARTYYTDHNGTATSGMQQGWATPEPTMDASRDVIIVLGASVYNIFLNQGWNLISIPLIPADTSIDAVLSTIAGQWDYIRVYDPLSPEPWLSNATFKPDQLNDFDTLDETQGFWIDITTASATLTVTGTEPVTTNIPLYAGWNLVGYPSFVEMSISGALVGTGYDRPVEGFDISEPYDIRQMSDFEFMKPGEAYWIHVPVDTFWMVENSVSPSMPYPVFGFVYLYDGTSAGGYAPLASMGGATVEVTWWDVYNGWRTIMTATNPLGQYSVDLMNYTDGGIVYVNATFDAPFGNMGYNYTYIDIMMGMSMQEVVCGVPYHVVITNPLLGMPLFIGLPFDLEYSIVDIDGVVAQGYFTWDSNPFDMYSSDPMAGPFTQRTFEGTADITPGQDSQVISMWQIGIHWIDVFEDDFPTNDDCLTPWGEFYLDPDNLIPGWLVDWARLDVQVFP